jgi:GTP-binding protein HflX
VDASHPNVHHQIAAVEEVLEEIGAVGLPMVLALNKIDRLLADTPLEFGGIAGTLPRVSVSARSGAGVEALLGCISETLMAQFDALDVTIPYDRGDLVAQFHQFGKIDLEEYRETGTHLRGYMPANHSGLFKVL